MKILNWLSEILVLIFMAALILICTFGNPREINNQIAFFAPFACTAIGISLFIVGIYALLTKKMVISEEKSKSAITCLLLVTGTLLFYVGGRWLWSWFYI